MAYVRKYPPPPQGFRLRSLALKEKLLFCKRSNRNFLNWLQRSVLRNLVRKKSSDPQGNIFHEFEGKQSRVSIKKSDGLNFKKYRIPDRTERLKSSLELHFTNSPLYGAFNNYVARGAGKLAVF